MPSRVKLLNAAAPGTTGTRFRIGMGQPPYVIRVHGGFALGGSGNPGDKGVNIETSPDGGTTWAREVGFRGGENETETENGEAVDLSDKAIFIINHYAKHIRGVFGANATGAATVFLEMNR
jgi:hypothetical protein